MRYLVITIIVILFYGKLSAQEKINDITCKVIDKDSKMPIENLLVINNKEKNKIQFTDEFGVFAVKTHQGLITEVSLHHTVYESKKMQLSNDEAGTIVIELQKKQIKLDAVTITAPFYHGFNKVSAIDIALRPMNTAQDALRIVPGLFIAQHAGGGKAEQIFLRGYDIDHGTDINITVDGMPVNMISHAHGQGYADLHFLIPETIDKVQFDKGPYNADKGNLATAGYVDFKTKNTIDKNSVKLEAGNFNTQRLSGLLKIFSKQSSLKNEQLYIAGEYTRTNGYFESPQNFYRANLFAKYHLSLKDNLQLNILASTFGSRWNASGQIPERAISNGFISRYGAIDDKEGGNTGRTNVAIQLQQKTKNDITIHQNAFFTNYRFNLFSNFTFFLEDSVNGDMINQFENRTIVGYNIKAKKNYMVRNKRWMNELGAGIRYDNIKDIHLAKSPDRVIEDYIQRGSLKESNYFLYYNNQLSLTPELSVNSSVRFDYFSFGYKNSILNEKDFQFRNKAIVSPKLNIQYNPVKHIQLFFKNGIGFHSNDTRLIIDQSVPYSLPKVFSTDIGANIAVGKKLFLQATLWNSYSQQEFVYVGDAGIVEPSGKASRIGIDWVARYQIKKWLYADMDISIAKARSIEAPKGENFIPLAPLVSSIGGLTAKLPNSLQASLRYRYLGNRPANEDYSITAKGYFLMDAIVNYQTKRFDFNIAVENVFNAKWKEAQFETTSRLRNEANPFTEIHFTPGIPFFVKVGVGVRF